MLRLVGILVFAIVGTVVGCLLGALLGDPIGEWVYGLPPSKRDAIIARSVYSAVGMFWGGFIGFFGGVLFGLLRAGVGGDRKPDERS